MRFPPSSSIPSAFLRAGKRRTGVVVELSIPPGTVLLFQPGDGIICERRAGVIPLGIILRAQRRMDRADQAGVFEDDRLVLICQGVEASDASRLLNWPVGQLALPGVVCIGQLTYRATLQLRARVG